jgi:hypothetical protein
LLGTIIDGESYPRNNLGVKGAVKEALQIIELPAQLLGYRFGPVSRVNGNKYFGAAQVMGCFRACHGYQYINWQISLGVDDFSD